MSKSLGNVISLSDGSESITRSVMSMYTDPKRIRATDPGTVEGNPVFIYHDAFNPDREMVEDLKTRYRLGKVGDVEVNRYLNEALQKFLFPIRERRIEAENLDIRGILEKGTSDARLLAVETLERVKDLMHLRYEKLNR